MVMDEYVTEFVAESEEDLARLNEGLLSLERNSDDPETLDRVFRIAHTLKGNCGSVGLDRANDLAHALEDVLDAIRSGTIEPDPELMDHAFEAVDVLEAMIGEAGSDGAVTTDPASTIDSLRAHLEEPGIHRPVPRDVDAIADRLDWPIEPDQQAYLVRIAVEPAPDLNNGLVVVLALEDAFDILGTDPTREEIEAGEYETAVDVVFAAAVGEAAIAAALEPVDAVREFGIVEVTERLADEESDDVEVAFDEDEFDPLASAEISTEEAQEMEVEDLLGEFDELDDIDELAEQIGDTSEFENMGEAGSFDDLFEEPAEPDPEPAAAEPSEPATTDEQPATDEVTTPVESEEVDDAQAVFEELQEEVEPVAFDELAEEIEQLEFDEYADEEEVGFDELIGEDVDTDDPTFLEPEPAEPVDAEPAAAAEAEPAEPVEAEPAEPVEAEPAEAAEAEPAEAVEAESAEAAEAEPAEPVEEEPAEAAEAEPAEPVEEEEEPAEAAEAEPAEAAEAEPAAAAEAEPAEAAEAEPAEAAEAESAEAAEVEPAEAAEAEPAEAAEAEPAEAAEAESAEAAEAEPAEAAEAEPAEAAEAETANAEATTDWECAGCGRSFDSPQALGGHVRSCEESIGPDEAPEEAVADDVAGTPEPTGDDLGPDPVSVEDSDPVEATEEPAAGELDMDIPPVEAEASSDVEDDFVSQPLAESELTNVDFSESEIADADASVLADDIEAVDTDGFEADLPAGGESGLSTSPTEPAPESPADDADAFEVDLEDQSGELSIEDPSIGVEEPAGETAETTEAATGASGDMTGPDLEIPEITIPEELETDPGADQAHVQSVRVDVETLDSLLTLVEGLVNSRVRLRDAFESDAPEDTLESEMDDLADLTGDLQELVMDVRLVPLENVVRRLPRTVRDIAREQEKRVDFEKEGTHVELDRGVLERIGDPLTHLVRNAVDHGIEPPEAREAAGKDPVGTIRLSAEQTRDRVTIEVSDDGRGLDLEAIRAEAVEAGVIDADEAEDLDDEAVADLIFNPGFSTTDEVTDVSGRGVGMDVVRRTVQTVDGNVEVESEPDEGTTVRLSLPVSVAIADVLFIDAGTERYGVPVQAVQDIERAAAASIENGTATIGDEELEAIRLQEALELDTAPRAENGGRWIVRIRDEVRSVALVCDDVAEQREVVVKPFEDFMGGIPGVSGATVAGRGEVVTILDVTTL